MKQVTVKPGEIIILKEDIITSLALGSSLGVCLYDPDNHIGGFVHPILPFSEGHEITGTRRLKYVDSSITELYHKMIQKGAKNLWAKLIGGATIFQLGQSGEEDVGKQNVKAAKNVLKKLGIPVKGEDTGDTYGRTIHFCIEDGWVYIETIHQCLYRI